MVQNMVYVKIKYVYYSKKNTTTYLPSKFFSSFEHAVFVLLLSEAGLEVLFLECLSR